MSKQHFKDNDSLEKAIREAGGHVALPETVRIRARAKLFQMMDRVPSAKIIASTSKRRALFSFSKSFAAIVLVVVIGFGSMVGAARADNSKPGDALFGVDTLIEDVQLFLISNPESKLRFQIAIAAERLQELAELSEDVFEDDSVDDVISGDNATSTDDGIANDTSTSTNSTDSVIDEAMNDSANEAILKSLSEIRSVLTKVEVDIAALDTLFGDDTSITQDRIPGLFNQLSALYDREDALIKRLDIRASHDRFDLKIEEVQNQSITICHMPDGELEIALISWPAHKAHGDVLGGCVVDVINDFDESDDDSHDSDDDDSDVNSNVDDDQDSKDNDDSDDDSDEDSDEDNDNDSDEDDDDSDDAADKEDSDDDDSDDDSDKDSFYNFRGRFDDFADRFNFNRSEKIRLEGIVEHIGERSIVVRGATFIVDDETDIEIKKSDSETLEAIEVGRWAKVKGEKRSDESILATEIDIK